LPDLSTIVRELRERRLVCPRLPPEMQRILGGAPAPGTPPASSGATNARGLGADVHASPVPRLQIGPGCNLGSCIRTAAAAGDPLPLIDDGRRKKSGPEARTVSSTDARPGSASSESTVHARPQAIHVPCLGASARSQLELGTWPPGRGPIQAMPPCGASSLHQEGCGCTTRPTFSTDSFPLSARLGPALQCAARSNQGSRWRPQPPAPYASTTHAGDATPNAQSFSPGHAGRTK
jgi:hypothetical protein